MVKHIDPNHYEKLWDWWFGSCENDFKTLYDFEVTGLKHKDGSYNFDNYIYVNVYYKHEYEIIKTLPVYIRKSWERTTTFMKLEMYEVERKI